VTDLYYSDQWQVVEERTNGTPYAQYVWSPVYVDAMILRDRDANGQTGDGMEERLYVQQDANWNVTGVMNPAGNVLERYAYDPYGVPTKLKPDWTGPPLTDYAWTYLHQGGRFDAASGLYSFRNRQYSPTLGRWVQVDPLTYEAGNNLYEYHDDNPVNFVDPLGLWWGLGGLFFASGASLSSPMAPPSPPILGPKPPALPIQVTPNPQPVEPEPVGPNPDHYPPGYSTTKPWKCPETKSDCKKDVLDHLNARVNTRCGTSERDRITGTKRRFASVFA
jgi:RHS repeat-associated protein